MYKLQECRKAYPKITFRVQDAVCFLLVSSAVTMAIPFSFGRIVDIIYKSDSTEVQSKLVTICSILLPIFIIGAACNFGRIYLINTSDAVCFLLVSSAVTMAIPFSFGRIVDIIYKSDSTEVQSKLVTICSILLPIFIIGAACNFGRIYLINTSGM
ncbi:ABC transporter type 1, transmembrane domain [Cinara cedri]|uniref:ABC transporter type 1, transmembrane domain n=1 Tax=Cinara cedri TaxID=506608 RepID=A0A5E4N352_9HEMI|nr:ABC transporter type 1, transmembrane domain [Cinara cedri]